MTAFIAGLCIEEMLSALQLDHQRCVYLSFLCPMLLQDFLQVFEQLREELVNDDLLGSDQPEASRDWVRKVRLLPSHAGVTFATATVR